MNIEVKIGTLAFLVHDNQILLGMKKRGFAEGMWNGYGGKKEELDATVEEAMSREVQEECGVIVNKYEKVGELEFTNDANEANKKWTVYIYLVTRWQGEIVETEEMRPQWFKYNEIPYDKMWPDDKEWLPRILRAEKIKGKFVLEGGNLKEFDIQML